MVEVTSELVQADLQVEDEEELQYVSLSCHVEGFPWPYGVVLIETFPWHSCSTSGGVQEGWKRSLQLSAKIGIASHSMAKIDVGFMLGFGPVGALNSWFSGGRCLRDLSEGKYARVHHEVRSFIYTSTW